VENLYQLEINNISRGVAQVVTCLAKCKIPSLKSHTTKKKKERKKLIAYRKIGNRRESDDVKFYLGAVS
jgi:hypothetical protein